MMKPCIVNVLLIPTVSIIVEDTSLTQRCPYDPIQFKRSGRESFFRNPTVQRCWVSDEKDSNSANQVVEKCFRYAGISNDYDQNHHRIVF